ncbi:MAG: enoyl-CoA hydratase-related protein [Salinisphaera sp.]|nr:enoyl-CoA hydratase-related protein [Salinisphaera sp.]
MSYNAFELTVADGLARLVMNQPERGNPFDADFCRELAEVANELADHDDLRAVLVTARGRYFSVGGDIAMFAENLDELTHGIRRWTAGLHMGIARLARLDAPIVAGVHATAMGGSVALVANFDLVFSAASARFGAAYAQIGYSCDAGASFALASRMGIARARRFLMLSEVLDAQQAQAAGLVDVVVADDRLAAEAERAAIRLANGPTRAYAGIRHLTRQAFSRGLEAAMEDEAQCLARVADSQDAREGILAFAEKRKPDFTGK